MANNGSFCFKGFYNISPEFSTLNYSLLNYTIGTSVCGKGKELNSAGTGCSPCPYGKYKDSNDANTDPCLDCPCGHSTPEEGSTSSSQCVKGKDLKHFCEYCILSILSTPGLSSTNACTHVQVCRLKRNKQESNAYHPPYPTLPPYPTATIPYPLIPYSCIFNPMIPYP